MSIVDTKDLEALLAALKKEPLTARKLAQLLSCSKPTIYKRLDDLRDRGVSLRTRRTREGEAGPPARAYFVDAGAFLRAPEVRKPPRQRKARGLSGPVNPANHSE
jgi:predicted ArsR family transcriptional regulator